MLQRIGGEANRRFQRLLTNNFATVIEARDLIGILTDHDLDQRARARVGHHVDHQVDALPGRQSDLAIVERERFDRLTIDGNHPDSRLAEQQVHHARIGDIDQAQTQAFAVRHRVTLFGRAIDGNDISHAPGVRPVVYCAEAGAMNLPVVVEAPVIDGEHQVLIDFRRVDFIDYQDSGEAQCLLRPGSLVGVIPVGSRIGRRQTVFKACAGHHRRLGHSGYTVHRVVDAQAVPMHGRCFVEVIFEVDNRLPTLGKAQQRAGDRLVVVHHPRGYLLRGFKANFAVAGNQLERRLLRAGGTWPKAGSEREPGGASLDEIASINQECYRVIICSQAQSNPLQPVTWSQHTCRASRQEWASFPQRSGLQPWNGSGVAVVSLKGISSVITSAPKRSASAFEQ